MSKRKVRNLLLLYCQKIRTYLNLSFNLVVGSLPSVTPNLARLGRCRRKQGRHRRTLSSNSAMGTNHVGRTVSGDPWGFPRDPVGAESYFFLDQFTLDLNNAGEEPALFLNVFCFSTRWGFPLLAPGTPRADRLPCIVWIRRPCGYHFARAFVSTMARRCSRTSVAVGP